MAIRWSGQGRPDTFAPGTDAPAALPAAPSRSPVAHAALPAAPSRSPVAHAALPVAPSRSPVAHAAPAAHAPCASIAMTGVAAAAVHDRPGARALPGSGPGDDTGVNRRRFIAALAGLAGALAIAPRARATARIDAVVGTAAGAGAAPRFDSIAVALAAAPPGERPFRIAIGAGTWRERLLIDRPNVHLVGAGRERTRIVHGTAAGHLRPDGRPWGTWGCATVIVRAAGFHATALAIDNDFDYPGHLREPTLETIGANGAQAVALMLDAGADRCRFDDIACNGHQDTLFVDAGRALFRGCTVSGSVDFVFGAGQALFERCRLHSRFRPGKPVQGYVAAPSTLASEPFGLVFRHCHLSHEPQVPTGTVLLGRPWRPTRDFADGRYGDPHAVGAATFIDCRLEAHIAAAGWDAMAYTDRSGARILLAPAQARLHELRSRGPGAAPSRPQLAPAQAGALQAALAAAGLAPPP